MKLSQAIAKIEEVVEIQEITEVQGPEDSTNIWIDFMGRYQNRKVGGSISLFQSDEGFDPDEMYANFDARPSQAGERAFSLKWDGSKWMDNPDPIEED